MRLGERTLWVEGVASGAYSLLCQKSVIFPLLFLDLVNLEFLSLGELVGSAVR